MCAAGDWERVRWVSSRETSAESAVELDVSDDSAMRCHCKTVRKVFRSAGERTQACFSLLRLASLLLGPLGCPHDTRRQGATTDDGTMDDVCCVVRCVSPEGEKGTGRLPVELWRKNVIRDRRTLHGCKWILGHRERHWYARYGGTRSPSEW